MMIRQASEAAAVARQSEAEEREKDRQQREQLGAKVEALVTAQDAFMERTSLLLTTIEGTLQQHGYPPHPHSFVAFPQFKEYVAYTSSALAQIALDVNRLSATSVLTQHPLPSGGSAPSASVVSTALHGEQARTGLATTDGPDAAASGPSAADGGGGLSGQAPAGRHFPPSVNWHNLVRLWFLGETDNWVPFRSVKDWSTEGSTGSRVSQARKVIGTIEGLLQGKQQQTMEAAWSLTGDADTLEARLARLDAAGSEGMQLFITHYHASPTRADGDRGFALSYMYRLIGEANKK
jgi:hypothetical protein